MPVTIVAFPWFSALNPWSVQGRVQNPLVVIVLWMSCACRATQEKRKESLHAG
jgi:hypothetical protein